MHRILHALATERFATLEAAGAAEEWVLRPLRRRAAGKALRDADAVTKLTDLAHLARVARLRTTPGAAEVDFDDALAVSAAYDALPPRTPAALPIQTLGLLFGLALVVASGFAVFAFTRPFAADGSGVGRALAQNFGGQVADVANGQRPSPEAALRRVFPLHELPAPAEGPMLDLFAAHLAAADDAARMPQVYEKTRDVNRAFAQLGQPFYLDARHYQGAPLLYAFYKEREDEGRAPGFAGERVVFLWRLDHLNISKAALGYTHREADAALVLYDQVEELLIRDVLPALAEGEKVELIDEASRDPKKAWQDDIETRSARMVRESFAGAADHDKLVELGSLLARRRSIVKRWQSDLAGQGKRLREPVRLLPEADYVKELWLLVPSASRREWEEVHDALASKAVTATFEALRDRFADNVARHELQHRFDGQKTPECNAASPCAALDIPAAVKTRVGPRDDAPVMLGSMPGRVRNETSAYLAEMARPGGMPKMTILGLLRTVLDREAWGDVYCNTTLVLLDVLGAELGLADPGMPLVVQGAVQRASVASLAALLFARGDDDLRAAAGKKWRDLYGYEVPAATMKLVTQGRRWRH